MSDSKLPPKEKRVYGKVGTMAELTEQGSVVKKRPRYKPEQKKLESTPPAKIPTEQVRTEKPKQHKNLPKSKKPEPKLTENWLLELKAALEKNNA
jgi:hypothetical protein